MDTTEAPEIKIMTRSEARLARIPVQASFGLKGEVHSGKLRLFQSGGWALHPVAIWLKVNDKPTTVVTLSPADARKLACCLVALAEKKTGADAA
jgi:hypothetical protein